VEWIENMLWRLCSAKCRYSCNREWNMQFFYEMTRFFLFFLRWGYWNINLICREDKLDVFKW
jgi:hypothetical protein